MNREIKFRGLNEKGEWVYGSYYHGVVYPSSYRTHNVGYWQVDENTVSQFTGLLDKNGKEIFEGDIVNQEKWVSVGKYEPSTGVVKYKGVGFTCECIGDWQGSNADLNGNATIIGNIYENPDLLK